MTPYPASFSQYFGELNAAELAGLILFGHAAWDRLLGYGLKYNDSFHKTHLGWIGKKAADR